MTEKQWEERKKQSRNNGTGGSDGSRDGSGAKKGGQAQPRNTTTPGATGETDREKCRYCGKKGHWARECRKKQRDEAAAAVANLTQKEDNREDGLYMATVVVELADSEATDAALAITATPDSPSSGEQVFLNEERAHVELRRAPHDKDPAWYLDTGASNHMTGDAGMFAELDKSVSGKVRFGDGSIVDIHGRGTILFAVDDERHRQLTGVCTGFPASSPTSSASGSLMRSATPPTSRMAT
jgi:hypothetical protein